MAVPASTTAVILPGNALFSAGGMPSIYLTGVFVKSVTAGGSVTVQDADGNEQTVQLATASGVTVTTGIPDPTGGSAGDLYLQLNASDQVIAFWENEAGTWAEYGIMGGSGVALSDDDPRSVSYRR